MSQLRKICPKCGNPFTSKRLLGVCPSCALMSLATLMEEECPGDSLRDISNGEQIGAWLREGVDPRRKGGAQ